MIMKKRNIWNSAWNSAWNNDGFLISFWFTFIFLFLAIVLLPISHMSYNGEIREFESTRRTIQTARKKGISTENSAVILSIIEKNDWLENAQYYNKTIYRLYVPNKVDTMKSLD